jgi:hypothetical protein
VVPSSSLLQRHPDGLGLGELEQVAKKWNQKTTPIQERARQLFPTQELFLPAEDSGKGKKLSVTSSFIPALVPGSLSTLSASTQWVLQSTAEVPDSCRIQSLEDWT